MLRHHRHLVSVLVAVALWCASNAWSQLPDGWIVAQSFRTPSTPGPAGLYFIPPSGGTPQAVTGLPPVVAGTAYPAIAEEGGDFVVRRPSDGALITNGWAYPQLPNMPLPLYILTLSGTAVTGGLVPYDLGPLLPQSQLGAPQVFPMPNGQILGALDYVGVPGVQLFIVDPTLGPPGTPGTVTYIPVVPQPASGGNVNALTFDPAAGLVYIAMAHSNNTSTIYAMTLGPVVSPVPIVTVPGSVAGLAMDNDGSLVAAKGGATSLVRVNLATNVVTPVAGAPANLNAVVVERVSGSYIVTSRDGSAAPYVYKVWRVPAGGGAPALLTSGLPGGWGVVGGLDVNPDPETYGAPTASVSGSSSWILSPNPGGLPFAGNGGFSVSIASSPGGTPGAFAITFAPLTPPQLAAGVLLHVDLGQLFTFGSLGGSPVETIPLALPPDPALVGAQGFIQAAHLSGSLATDATAGLRITIL